MSSKPSSSSCSLSQSQGAFRFLFLHSHPCLRLVLIPSVMSSSPWEGDWNLLPKIPISSLSKRQNTQNWIRSAFRQSCRDQCIVKIRKRHCLRLCFCNIAVRSKSQQYDSWLINLFPQSFQKNLGIIKENSRYILKDFGDNKGNDITIFMTM